MNNPIRKIQRLADWLDDREATRLVCKHRALYAPKVAGAEKVKDWNEQQSLLNEWEFENDLVRDPVYATTC